MSVAGTTASPALNNTPNRLLTPIDMNAVAGAGEGKLPSNCDPSDVIRTIGGAAPDTDGSFTLSLEGCFRETMPFAGGGGTVTVTSPNTNNLDNDCEACCSCQDYADSYNELLRIQGLAIPTGARLNQVRTQLQFIINSMQIEKANREQKDIELFVVSRTGWVFNILIVLYNNPPGDDTLGTVTVGTTYGVTGKMKVIPDSAFVYNPGDDDVWRPYTLADTDWDDPAAPILGEDIKGNNYIAIAYEIFFEEDDARTDGTSVTMDVDGGSYGTDNKDAELKEPFDGTI